MAGHSKWFYIVGSTDNANKIVAEIRNILEMNGGNVDTYIRMLFKRYN